jgi:hypothetical protein
MMLMMMKMIPGHGDGGFGGQSMPDCVFAQVQRRLRVIMSQLRGCQYTDGLPALVECISSDAEDDSDAWELDEDDSDACQTHYWKGTSACARRSLHTNQPTT